MPTKDDLRLLQSLPLEVKVAKTKQRIREWVTHFGKDGVYVSFSGGKDSTVLLHLVRELYPDIEAVFINTGLEYPEIQKFVKTFDNVTILRPKMRFDEVIKKYGYAEDPEQMSLDDFGYDCGRKLCTTGCNRTGCIFCAFGAHLDKESRFERLKKTHPRQYEYCIGGGEYVDGVWQPSKDGLGMGHVFDELNRIYGDGFIRY